MLEGLELYITINYLTTLCVGRANMAADWFHRLGFTLPYAISAPDFILDLASGDVSTAKLDGEVPFSQ